MVSLKMQAIVMGEAMTGGIPRSPTVYLPYLHVLDETVYYWVSADYLLVITL